MSTRPFADAPVPAAPFDAPSWTGDRLVAEVAGVLPPGTPLLAFSGGADSSALLHALLRVPTLRRLVVAHVDHGLDPGSSARARAARDLARSAAERAAWRFDRSHGEPSPGEDPVLFFVHQRLAIHHGHRRRHGGVEASARVLRYRALETLRRRTRAGVVLTAHHADDQLETLVLRLRQGSGLVGLGGIRARARGPGGAPILRPLLALDDPPSAEDLRAVLSHAGLSWIEDPTNTDLSLVRNSVRRRTLPTMLRTEPDTPTPHEAAVRLARAAARFASWRERWAREALDLRLVEDGVDLDFERWRRLPRSLRDHALGALHRAAGERSDPSAAARCELDRQVAAQHHDPRSSAPDRTILSTDPEQPEQRSSPARQLSGPPKRCMNEATRRIACAAGSGRQWVVVPAAPSPAPGARDPGSGARLQLRAEPPRSDAPSLGGATEFTYTPRIPGVTEMPEIGCTLQVTREPYDRWMARAWPDRAACHLPDPRATVTVRNRTTGDTLHPFGSPSKRVKLKKLLIDRKIPRDQRSRLPLVCVDGEIAWVPGVTIGDSFRIPARLAGQGPPRSGDRSGKSDEHSSSNQLVWVFRLSPHRSPETARSHG